ncbi:MAG: hypothetical protein V3S69_05935 [Dehalococcoidales bacterium]
MNITAIIKAGTASIRMTGSVVFLDEDQKLLVEYDLADAGEVEVNINQESMQITEDMQMGIRFEFMLPTVLLLLPEGSTSSEP